VGRWDPPFWYGSREFSPADVTLMQQTVRRFAGLGFSELLATICEILPWKAPNGQLKVEACRQLLLQWEAAGLVQLPARRPTASAARAERVGTPPPSPVVHAALHEVQPIRVEPIAAGDGPTWNAMMTTHHPLGFRRAFGAQQKYWVRSEAGGRSCILGGLVFAAAAKALAVRDDWIGWSPQERQRCRERIVANSRYLLLPDVVVPHLASHVLALTLKRLPGDWARRYGFEPALVETFVEQPWPGTCYRAANWLCLGQTAGRGRQDREHAKAATVKTVWVYPLTRHWRERLLTPLDAASGARADA